MARHSWLLLDDAQALPARGAVSVSWARWQTERNLLRDWTRRGKARRLGVRVTLDTASAELPAAAPQALDGVALLRVESGRFTDGRVFSLARILREHLGYAGELHAVGDLLPDQIPLLRRCGFDTVELHNGLIAGEAAPYVTAHYRIGAPGREPSGDAPAAQRPPGTLEERS